MDEFQIMSLFNSALISNGLYTAAAFFLLWVAFRGALIIYNEGAPLFNKISIDYFFIRNSLCKFKERSAARCKLAKYCI